MQSRQRRKKSPFFVVEGLRTCEEAIRRRPNWVAFVVTTAEAPALPNLASFQHYLVSEKELNELSSTDTPQGILVVCKKPAETTPSSCPDPFILLLDQVSDPGNVGTILRTAWAIGLQHVFWTAGTADPWSAKTIRSGMGAQFALNTSKFADSATALDAAAKLGYNQLWQATPHGGTNCYDDAFTLKGSVLSIGNETVDTRDLTGNRVCIPMPGNAESLNVAQAATILLFESVRRKLI